MKFAKTTLAAVVCFGLAAFSWTQSASSAPNSAKDQSTRERARVVLSQNFPPLDGSRLKATLVEVNYGPGEASTPHSHPCAVIGYVAEGTLRTQVQGEPERVYKAGESFYEAPNGVHLVSANASATKPAKLIAYLLCDHEGPLSVDVPSNGHANHDGATATHSDGAAK